MNLKKFNTISLNDLDNVSLLRRYDSKFVFHCNMLPVLLEDLVNHYKILDIDDNRIFKYNNVYYDTDDLFSFISHHNGSRSRHKFRTRKYVDSDISFFELKIKNNKNKTIKKRIKISNEDGIENQNIKEFIKKNQYKISNRLSSKLFIDFDRMTFIDNDFKERVTIDINFKIKGDKKNIFDQLVVAEIKQERFNPKSNFIKILRKHKIYKMKFSKYCIGMLSLNYKSIKYNRFKEQLTYINKLKNKAHEH